MTIQGIKDFLSAVQDFSRQNPKLGFLVNQSNFCFPVMISDSVPQDVRDWIESMPGERAKISIGFPIVASLRERAIYYSDKTPLFGAAHYRGFREFAKNNLSFG